MTLRRYLDMDRSLAKVAAEEHISRNTVTYRVRIPANSTATLYLPANVDGGKVHQLGAGSHTLTLRVAK